MKKLIILLCFCACTFIVKAQTTFVLKHQKDTTFSLKLKPYKYTHKKCDTVELEITFVYDQVEETISVIISSKKQSDYNFVWIPPKDNGFYFTSLSKFKKDFKNKYNVNVSLKSHFKKQIKKVKITELYPITCRNCEFSGYNVPDTAKCTAGGSPEKPSKLQNEMFNINILDSMNIQSVLNFKVLNKANVVDMRFFGFVPVIIKNSSKKYSKKLQLQYIADGPLFNLKIQREICVDAIEELKEVNRLIENLKSDYNDLETAKAENKRKEYDQIKNKVKMEDKNLKIDELYGQSKCQALLSAVEEYHSWVEKISKYMSCPLDPSEINQAAVKINKLVTKWDLNKNTDISEVPDIIKNTDAKIKKYGSLCGNNKKVQESIDSYNGAVDFYNVKVKK